MNNSEQSSSTSSGEATVNQVYVVEEFYLAAYLLTKGFGLVEVVKGERDRSRFLFDRHPEIEHEAYVYNKTTPTVDVHSFTSAIRRIKSLMYSGWKGKQEGK